jgi:hypothetical protein
MKTLAPKREALRVADEAWVALALLHREHPERPDFTVQEILTRAEIENLAGSLRPSLTTHISYHCVANKPPKPSGYRMFFATGEGTRRLFREGDPTDSGRKGKITPKPDDLPEKYQPLLDWYQMKYVASTGDPWLRGIFEMIGADRDIWAGVDADEYVRELREGWD